MPTSAGQRRKGVICVEIDKDLWNWMVEMAENAPLLGVCEEEFGVAAVGDGPARQ